MIETAYSPHNINLCGVRVTPVTVDQLHASLAATIAAGERRRVLHINVHGANLAQSDQRLRQILNSADLVFCDGFGIRVGAYLLGHRIPPRITYADWMWQLGAFAEERGYSLFLLGAQPGVAEQAAARLTERFPDLQIAGVHHGYFAKAKDSAENAAVIAKINAAGPHILLACFGMPVQEYWLDENWDALTCNIGLVGGAALDYISGNLRRGPAVLTQFGFEWLARLLIEPRRLWKRYVLGNPRFLLCVLRQRFGGGSGSRQAP